MKNLDFYKEFEDLPNDFSIRMEEKDFIQMRLHHFIESNAVYFIGDASNADDMTILYRLLLNEILKNFNLKELYKIDCFESPYVETDEVINARKEKLIGNVFKDSDFSEQERKMFEKKIGDIPNVLLLLIMKLIERSNLFWDCETEKHAIPDLSKVKINYIDFCEE